MSKYRNDIDNILSDSLRRARTSEPAAAKYLNDDNYGKKKIPEQLNKPTSYQVKSVNYCPKPEPTGSMLNTLTSKFMKTAKDKPIDLTNDNDPYDRLKDIRGGRVSSTKAASADPTEFKSNINIKKESVDRHPPISSFASDISLQISKFLPYLVLIILTLVAVQYIHIKLMRSPNTTVVSESESVIFPPSPPPVKASLYCADIKDTRCLETKHLIKELIDYLREKSGQVECSAISSSKGVSDPDKTDFIEKSMHLNQVIDYLFNMRALVKNEEDKQVAIESVLGAIQRNPHWEILFLDQNHQQTSELDNVTYLMSLVSSKAFSCRFKELVYFVYVRVIMFASLIVAAVCGYLLYAALKKMRLESDKAYYSLITSVTAMVEKQYELSLLDPVNIKPYIAVSHIYDTLFEPSERASKKKLWNKIIAFIQDHESRIHLETQFINGEETHVWKWIVPKHDTLLKKYTSDSIGLGNSTMMPHDKMTHKSGGAYSEASTFGQDMQATNVWQGDAFDRSEKLKHSPTSCLKIRNMFDPATFDADKLLPLKIHNDILKKCNQSTNDKAGILHISCDKKSKEGFVYVKCVNNDAAGCVYQTLNGTWYDGKLLNVKFLRADRYLERFPDSINANQPLKPICL